MCPILGSIPIMGCLVIESYIFGMQVKHALAHIPAQPHHGETHITEKKASWSRPTQRSQHRTEPEEVSIPVASIRETFTAQSLRSEITPAE